MVGQALGQWSIRFCSSAIFHLRRMRNLRIPRLRRVRDIPGPRAQMAACFWFLFLTSQFSLFRIETKERWKKSSASVQFSSFLWIDKRLSMFVTILGGIFKTLRVNRLWRTEDTCVISISLRSTRQAGRFQRIVTLWRCHEFGCVSWVQTPSYKIVRVFLLKEL